MNTKKKGQGEVNHAAIAWALAATLAAEPESATARRIIEAADAIGAATGTVDAFDYRSEHMLRNLLETHTAPDAYEFDAHDRAGTDREKGERAYRTLVRLAGGVEGAPEPKDKTSSAWRHWTLRRIRADFESPNTEAYGTAWDEFRFFVAHFLMPDSATVNSALATLPGLLVGFQQRERVGQRERRSAAARKGAQNRAGREA